MYLSLKEHMRKKPLDCLVLRVLSSEVNLKDIVDFGRLEAGNCFIGRMLLVRSSSSMLIPALLLLFLCGGEAQQSDSKIEQVLDKADSLVQELANQAILNQQNTCESLPNCTIDKCLRGTCRPQSQDEIKHLQCSQVVAGAGCSSSCNNVYISTNQSYVRVPPLASLSNDYDLQESLCAQKPLNEKLKQGWQSSSQLSNGWFFFGGAAGFLYVYPGRDYLDDQSCNQYDSRIRPWYINALAVVKSLYILLDSSPGMSLQIGSLSPSSHLDVAKGIVNELLKTLVNGDEVAVSKINADQLIGKAVSVSLENIDMSFQQPEIQDLQTAVSKSKADATQMDLKQALTGALKFFNTANSSSSLKIVMILTDGNFAGSLNVTDMDPVLQQLNQENVVLFLYRIGYDGSNDGKLQQMKSRLNMSFDTVTDSDNPLWRIQSYFDYIAWLRFINVKKAPTWVPLYPDVAGLGNITTASFPAFDANQRLIGVVGLDLDTTGLVNELGLSAVDAAVSNRSRSPSIQPAFALIQNVANRTITCVQSGPLAPVCQKGNLPTPLSNFMCCGQSCSASGGSGKHSDEAAVVGSSVGGSLVVLALVASLLYVCFKRRARRKQDEAKFRDNAAAEAQKQREEWITPGNPSPNAALVSH